MSNPHDESTDEPAESPPPGDGAMEHHAGPREDEVSLLDILLVLARHKTLIVRTVLLFTFLGVTYSLLAPKKFTSAAKVVRETGGEGPNLPGGLGGLAGGLAGGAISGLLGGSSSGLGPEAYPEILQGRAVRLKVVRDTFRFPDAEHPMTLVEYVDRPPGIVDVVLKYSLQLPWTIKEEVGKLLAGTSTPEGTTAASAPTIPSEEEDAALKTAADMISVSVNEESGLMTLKVSAGGPRLAAALVESFLEHFKSRVREIRTEKVREKLGFVEQRLQEVKKELEIREERLAQFLERNQNPTTAMLRFRRDRLQRQVDFKQQLYTQLQSQRTKTRLELQQQQPVLTVVEEGTPPLSRSWPKRTLITVFSFLLGGFVGTGIAFVKTAVQRKEGTKTGRKLEEIREALFSGRVGGTVRRIISIRE